MNTKELFVAYLTIVRKELKRFLSVWGQSLLPSGVTTTLYFLVFGSFLGEKIGKINDIEYITFIAPGLIMMSIITNSYSNTSFSFYVGKLQKSIEELLVSPVPNWIKLLGYVTGGIARGMITGLIVFFVSLFFIDLSIFNIWIIFGFFLLSSSIFSLIGLINGVYAKSFDGINIVPAFVLTPLIYLGGVFYSVQSLPETWQKISEFNPLFYIINGFRYGFTGVSDIDIKYSFLILVILIIILSIIALTLIKKGIGVKS